MQNRNKNTSAGMTALQFIPLLANINFIGLLRIEIEQTSVALS